MCACMYAYVHMGSITWCYLVALVEQRTTSPDKFSCGLLVLAPEWCTGIPVLVY